MKEPFNFTPLKILLKSLKPPEYFYCNPETGACFYDKAGVFSVK